MHGNVREQTTPEEYEKLKFFLHHPKLSGFVFRVGFKIVNESPVRIDRLAYAVNPDKQEIELNVVHLNATSYRIQSINSAFIYDTHEQAIKRAKEIYESELVNLKNKWAIALQKK